MRKQPVDSRFLAELIDWHSIDCSPKIKISHNIMVRGFIEEGEGYERYKDMLINKLARDTNKIIVNGHKSSIFHFDLDYQPLIDESLGKIYNPNAFKAFDGYRSRLPHRKYDIDSVTSLRQKENVVILSNDSHSGFYQYCIRNDLNRVGFYDGQNTEHTIIIAIYKKEFKIRLHNTIWISKDKDVRKRQGVVVASAGVEFIPTVDNFQSRVFVKNREEP